MSTYKSCWSWSVSQFSTCMSLLRHGFRNSKTGSQMYTFPDQMNWQFVQILMDSKFHSKLRVLDTDYVKQNSWAKDFFVFCSGKICLVLFQGSCYFVLRHLCPVHKLNAQTPITTILEWMDWSYRKPYICLSFNFWKQYPADGICLTSVNMQKYVISPWPLFVYKAAKHRYIFLRGVGLEM